MGRRSRRKQQAIEDSNTFKVGQAISAVVALALMVGLVYSLWMTWRAIQLGKQVGGMLAKAVIMGILVGLLGGCSGDDEPAPASIYGVWVGEELTQLEQPLGPCPVAALRTPIRIEIRPDSLFYTFGAEGFTQVVVADEVSDTGVDFTIVTGGGLRFRGTRAGDVMAGDGRRVSGGNDFLAMWRVVKLD